MLSNATNQPKSTVELGYMLNHIIDIICLFVYVFVKEQVNLWDYLYLSSRCKSNFTTSCDELCIGYTYHVQIKSAVIRTTYTDYTYHSHENIDVKI